MCPYPLSQCIFVFISTTEGFYMCKRNYKNEHVINHNTFMYFHLCPARGVCVLERERGGGHVMETIVSVHCQHHYWQSDLTVISMHGSEQTSRNPKHNVSIITWVSVNNYKTWKSVFSHWSPLLNYSEMV